jgi:hypothetical protein
LALELGETRRCYDCGLVKPITEFAFAHKTKGTRQGRCRRCHAGYRRAHYLRNRDVYVKREVARIKRYRNENRPLIREYLRLHPCVDCGETDIVVLDFDHRDPATKSHNVVVLATQKPWARVLAEIAKCEVRCANCHRRRTALQFNWRASRPESKSLIGRARPRDVGLFEFAANGDSGVKRCGSCGLVKPLCMFPFKDRVLGKRGSRCLACMAAYSRQHYRQNRASYLKKARRSRWRVSVRNRQLVFAYLRDHPCVDCGESDPLLLDFDHRDPASKLNDVARLAHFRPWDVVLEEISKCDVRCANCHRRRTARQFGWSKLELPPPSRMDADAGVAQLAERNFPKVEVAGSCPVSRSEERDVDE